MALVTATLREDFNSGIIGQSITTENTNLTFVTPGCFFGDGYAGTTGMEGYADLTEVNGFAGFAGWGPEVSPSSPPSSTCPVTR